MVVVSGVRVGWDSYVVLWERRERERGGEEGQGGSRGMEGKRQFLIAWDYFAHGQTTNIPGH